MLLKSREVVFDVLTPAHSERVVTVGENNGLQMMLILQQVAAMNMGDGNPVLSPHCRSGLCPLTHNPPALLNEIVVCVDKIVNECCGATSFPHGCGDQVDQLGISSDIWQQKILFYWQRIWGKRRLMGAYCGCYRTVVL